MADSDLQAKLNALTPGQREQLKRLLAARTAAPNGSTSSVTAGAAPAAIPMAPQEADYPLSFAQQRLWLQEQLAEGKSGAYNLALAVRIRGNVDRDALEKAFESLVAKHEVLHTRLVRTDGEPRQRVLAAWTWRVERWTAVPPQDAAPEDPAAQFQRRAEAFANRPFELQEELPVRVACMPLAEDALGLAIVFHHVACDGASLPLLLDDLRDFYQRALTASETGPVTSPPLSRATRYVDYAVWHRGWMQAAEGKRAQDYWLRQFADLPEPLELPSDYPRPPVQDFAGSHLHVALPAGIRERLAQVGQGEGASLFMTLYACVAAFLHRITGQEDITLGAPTDGRFHPALERQVGLFVNTLALRIRVGPHEDFLSLLRRAREVVIDGFEHQACPFDVLVDALPLERDLSRPPLFNVMLGLTRAADEAFRLPGVQVEPVPLALASSKVDLTFHIVETADDLALDLEYATALFTPARVRQFASWFENLLGAVVAAPAGAVGDLPLMTEPELQALIAGFNPPASDFPRERGLVELFREQVRLRPAADAVAIGGRAFSYATIDVLSDQIAARLIERLGRVTPEEPIALQVERSERMIAAILGILKAGGCYLPVNPGTPPDRTRALLTMAGARLRLTEQEPALSGWLGQDGDLRAWCEPGGLAGARPVSAHSAGRRLAYIIFTSGSTGEPKGVRVEQRAVVRLVRNTDFLQLGAGDRVLQTGSLAFDASTFEIWGPLLNGGCCCLPRGRELLELEAFDALLEQTGATTVFLTTGLFNQIADLQPSALARLRTLLTGGEKVSVPHVNRVLAAAPALTLLHVYGPTENTTFSSWHRVVGRVERDVPIGRAIAHSTLYVLDARGNLLPPGIPGEIHCGGEGLARDYLARPELTAERFIPDPFSGRRGARLYRTGDFGRWNAQGNIEFIGRRDDQVKVRGFRIELGEIELRLRALPSVQQAVVIARPSGGTHELVAYVAGATARIEPELRAALARTLPDYMVPARFVFLPRLPLNASGKVDRRALPAPERIDVEETDQEPAWRNAAERALAQAWTEVLGRRPVSREAHYFNSGGDSIKAIQMTARLRAQGFRLSLRDVFARPHFNDLAAALVVTGTDRAEDGDSDGDVPLTPIQCWFLESFAPPYDHFNQATLLESSERLDPAALHRALEALVGRHPMLRCRLQRDVAGGKGWTQRIGPRTGSDFAWRIENLRELESATAQARFAAAAQSLHEGLSLADGRLLAAGLFQGQRTDRLLLVIHHWAVDGVSWRILLEELEALYTGETADRPTTSLQTPVPFRSWARALRSFAQTLPGEPEADYWRDVAREAPSWRGDEGAIAEPVREIVFPAALTTELLSTAHRAYGTQVPELLLAALSQTWQDAGGDSLLLAMEGHGRESAVADTDVAQTVGWFTSLWPFVLRGAGDWPERIRTVKDALRAVPGRGVGYGALRYLSGDEARKELGRLDPRVSFNYLGAFGTEVGSRFRGLVGEPTGEAAAPHLRSPFALDIVAEVAGDQLRISFHFHQAVFDARGREEMVRRYGRAIEAMVAHLRHTPARRSRQDFTGGVSSLGELDRLVDASAVHGFEIEDILPLTPMQQGMVAHALSAPDSPAYADQVVLRLTGPLDRPRFEQAWQALGTQHPALRTVFRMTGTERPVGLVGRGSGLGFNWVDLSSTEDAASPVAERIAELRRSDRAAGFDLMRGPLLRLSLVRLAPDRHEAILGFHHSVLDGWSSGLIWRTLEANYRALSDDQPITRPPATFSDYLRWLGRRHEGRDLEAWKRVLVGCPPGAAVPPGTPRLGAPAIRTRSSTWEVGRERTGLLAAAARRLGTTENSLFQALWGVFLGKLTQRTDVVFGATVSGRSDRVPHVESIVGLLIATVPVRVKWTSGASLDAIAVQVHAQAADQVERIGAPVGEIQAAVLERGELLQHTVVFENYPDDDSAAADRLWQIETVAVHDPMHFEFGVLVVPRRDGWLCRIIADEARYPDAYLAQVRQAWEEVLERCLRAPEAPVESWNLDQWSTRTRPVVVAATFTAEPIEHPLSFWQESLGYAGDVRFAPFNQVFQQLCDTGSEMHGNRTGLNLLLVRLADWIGTTPDDPAVVEQSLEFNGDSLIDGLRRLDATGSRARHLVLFCPASPSRGSSHVVAAAIAQAEARLIRRIAAIGSSRVHAIPAAALAAGADAEEIHDPAGETLGGVPYTEAFFATAATTAVRWWEAVTRPPLKVLALDADHTLWRGVVGEDGVDGIELTAGHRALQEAARAARGNGRLLVLVSKNDPETLREVFQRRSDFPLRWDDFAAVEASWRPKSDGLRNAASRLNLGLDSFLFLDDSAMECAEAAAALPEVTVLQVPEAPADLAQFVAHCWPLDTPAGTAEDRNRSELYQVEAQRQVGRQAGGGLRGFIQQLQLEVGFPSIGPQSLARAAQLTQRTNQFNASTLRRTEPELQAFLAAPGNRGFLVEVRDRFGAYGITGLVLFHTGGGEWTVDTLLLSCRVLGRGVEHAVMRRLASEAAADGAATIRVQFAATAKNAPAQQFLRTFAAVSEPGAFRFDVQALTTIEVGESDPVAAPSAGVAVDRGASLPAVSAVYRHIAVELNSVAALLRAVTEHRARRRQGGNAAPYVAPRGEIEEQIAAIWTAVLGIDRVGRDNSFFGLGGHSLPAVMMLSRVNRAFGIELPLDSIFAAPVLAAFANRVAVAPVALETLQRITAAALAADYPLSHAQRRLWLIEQMRGDGPSPFHMSAAFELVGPLDPARLKEAVRRLVMRHESLRTAIVMVDGTPRQRVHSETDVAIETLGADLPEGAALPASVLAEFLERPFDFTRPPLLRVGLRRMGDATWRLAVVMHHAVSDGWSIGVMARELAGYYLSRDAVLPPLPVHYKDYAVWQARELDSGPLRRAAHFWRSLFENPPPPLELPADRARPAVKQSRGAEVVATFEKRRWDELKRQILGEGASPFMALLAVLQLLLARQARTDRFVIGTPVAGRDQPELESQIGFYVNLLPIVAEVDAGASFRSHLGRVRESVVTALNHAAYPFDRLVDDLDLPRDLSRQPLFDVLMVFQGNAPAELTLDEVKVQPVTLEAMTSQYDVTFEFVEADGGLRLRLEYDVALFDAPRMTRLVRQFFHGLSQVFASPDAKLGMLSWSPPEEIEQLRRLERGPRYGSRCARTIWELVAGAGEREPDGPAIVANDRCLPYRELERRTSAVAAALRRSGVARRSVVAVAGLRSEEFIVAMLGVMRADCIHLPIELKHPDERLRFTLEDAGVRHGIAIGSEAEERFAALGVTVVRMDGPDERGGDPATGPRVDPEDIAYLIYTSGSTGRPKGVEVSHRAFATMITAQAEAFGVKRGDRCGWWASCAFDASMSEIFLALVTGATVVVAEDPEREDADRFLAWLRKSRVTVATLPPAFLRVLNRAPLDPLRVLITAGEAADPADARHYARRLQYFNAYGPTETAVCATLHRVDGDESPADRGSVPIGRPLAPAAVYILDAARQRVPLGVPGELYIGGWLVAQGYRNAPALSAEKFVPDPFEPVANETPDCGAAARLYRTGDLARWREDGALEFLGRVDRQVKIRGFRIELGEVEATLRATAGVRDAAVLPLEQHGRTVLVGYLAAEPTAVEAARAAVTGRLPDYMRPSAYVCVSRLPVNSSGKLDLAALPAPCFEAGADLTDPATIREQALAAAWQECLGVERVGRESDFFVLGGDSIQALRLISAVRARGWNLGLKTVFAHPRLQAQAEQLTSAEAAATRVIAGPLDLLPIQKWFLETHGDSPLHHFNQAVTYRTNGVVDERRLLDAVQSVWARHAALRATFEFAAGAWRQVVLPPTAPPPILAVLDVMNETAERAAACEAEWVRSLQAGFDLKQGPLIRYGLLRAATGTKILCLTHHLVSDWVSHRILLDDLNVAYAAGELTGGGCELDAWLAAGRAWASSAAARNAGEAWRAVVGTMPAKPKQPPAGRYGDVTVITRKLSANVTARLVTKVATLKGATVRDALAAAIARAQHRTRGEPAVALQLEGHGRDAFGTTLDVSRTVGWFTTLYPFRAALGSDDRGLAAVARIRDSLAELPDTGFGYAYLRDGTPDAGVPAAQTSVSLNYLGEFAAPGGPAIFRLDDALPTGAISPGFERDHPVDVSAWIFAEQLNILLAFVPGELAPLEMERWLDELMAFLEDLSAE